MKKQDRDIIVKGARVHNLKNVTVHFPHQQFIVVTGVSGSGKSSLTMDTLFAEGQRRYVESLSSYARQFMKSMPKPDVDSIEGLCPAIAIEQKVSARTPRSTVGSLTEVNDYLRLLFAKIGHTFSPVSGKEVQKDEVQDVVDFIRQIPHGKKVWLLIPMPAATGCSILNMLDNLMHKGYTRLYHAASGDLLGMEEALTQTNRFKKKEDVWYVLVDRYVTRDWEEDDLHRMADSVQTAFDETHGDIYIQVETEPLRHFCNRFELDGIRFEEPTPHFFASNNPFGACPQCEGYGQVIGIDPSLVIPDKNRTLYDGAVACWSGDKMAEWKTRFIFAYKDEFPVHKPIHKLSSREYALLWEGKHGINDFFRMVEDNLYKIQYRVLQARYRGKTLCPSCTGSRLRKEALWVKIAERHFGELQQWPVDQLAVWMKQLQLPAHEQQTAKRILQEIDIRLHTLLDVGLHYLTLSRTANTLSGGESQRIQLTRVIGSNLTDSLYILDEPSIGLHPRDTERLIQVLQKLKALGNTVVVVEHDDQMMREADYIIDMGPLASHLGGEVVAAGPYKQLLKSKESLTASYLKGEKKVGLNRKPRKPRKPVNHLELKGCRLHNLRDVDIRIPLRTLTVVSGVSGSGKTSLIKHILYPALRNRFGDFSMKPGDFQSLEGDLDAISAVEMVDQNPIGKSSRSNPVTYIKAYDEIRNLFAAQQLSKVRGYTAGYFSFNVDGGRCDTCKGEGETLVEMQFLADLHLTCESCKGRRFRQEILDVQYAGKHIADVLDLSVDEALLHFEGHHRITEKLKNLQDVGLGYVKLGQSSDTLSGGEAQRVKLASYLDRSFHHKKICFIFDEPTTGLHFHDIQKLLQSFDALIEQGHSVLVIEHNPDVIRNADWIIDLGPEGGAGGGQLVYEGPVSGLKKSRKGYTWKYI